MLVLDGFKRVIGSAKVQLMSGTVATAFVALVTSPGDFASKKTLWEGFLFASFALIGAIILGWAHEDAAAKSGPATQTNVNSDVTNPPAVPPVVPVAKPDPIEPAPMPILSGDHTDAIVNAVLAELKKRANAGAKASAAANVPIRKA